MNRWILINIQKSKYVITNPRNQVMEIVNGKWWQILYMIMGVPNANDSFHRVSLKNNTQPSENNN